MGIAWMAETMFGAHMDEIKGTLGSLVKDFLGLMQLSYY